VFSVIEFFADRINPCDIQRHFIPGETHSIYWERSCVIRRCRIRRWSGRSIVFREKQKRIASRFRFGIDRLSSLLHPATIADSGYAMVFAMRQLWCSQA